MKKNASKIILLVLISLCINIFVVAKGKKNSRAASIKMKASHHTVYFKFYNANSAHATILITDTHGEEKFYIEDADISSGEFSILIPSANNTLIVNVLLADFSFKEKVVLNN
jgi:hypothetical protein